jgi:RimJ/RimL family protein N-acetyltransferase
MMNLSLRNVHQDDLPIFFEHEQDAAAVHMAAFTPEDPTDHDAFAAHWQRLLESETIIKRTVLLGDVVAGHVASWVQDGDREITYWIDRRHWGKGIATTALQLFMDVVSIRPLYARAAKDNIASIRVLEKCGFVVVGQERGYANARGREIDELVLKLGT